MIQSYKLCVTKVYKAVLSGVRCENLLQDKLNNSWMFVGFLHELPASGPSTASL